MAKKTNKWKSDTKKRDRAMEKRKKERGLCSIPSIADIKLDPQTGDIRYAIDKYGHLWEYHPSDRSAGIPAVWMKMTRRAKDHSSYNLPTWNPNLYVKTRKEENGAA